MKRNLKVLTIIFVLIIIGFANLDSIKASCVDFETEETCKLGCTPASGSSTCDAEYSCIWNDINIDGTNYRYCHANKLLYVKCGGSHDIPYEAPKIISFVINLLKIATPILLILVSVITLLKAMASSKDDEIKKAHSSLVKKLISAALVFFVISIVQFVITKVADSGESGNISNCLSCFLNNDCGNSLYYKTNIGKDYYCTELGKDNFQNCETYYKN